MSSNQDAETSAIEAKQKELEGVFNPIMSKVYQAAGGAPPGAGGFPGGAGFPGAGGPQGGSTGPTSGPHVDEVD